MLKNWFNLSMVIMLGIFVCLSPSIQILTSCNMHIITKSYKLYIRMVVIYDHWGHKHLWSPKELWLRYVIDRLTINRLQWMYYWNWTSLFTSDENCRSNISPSRCRKQTIVCKLIKYLHLLPLIIYTIQMSNNNIIYEQYCSYYIQVIWYSAIQYRSLDDKTKRLFLRWEHI